MRDNALFAGLITVIQAGLSAQGLTVGIRQSYQPTQQGVPAQPYVFIHKLGEKRYGFPARTNVINQGGGSATHTETQQMITMFQVDALAIQDPANVASITAADYVKAVALALQNEVAIASLLALGIGIFRISEIKQSYFKDEKARNESSPLFEFSVTHNDTIVTQVGSTKEVIATLDAV